MKGYGLIGLAVVLAVVVSMIPASAVPMTNVTIYAETVKLYEHLEGQNPMTFYCLKNDSIVNLTVIFELNHTIPDTYTIWLVGQPVSGTNFDFSNASVIYLKRTNMTTTQTFDFTTKTQIRTDLIAGRYFVYVIGTNEGNQTNLVGKQKFELKLRNVKTPPMANQTYHIAMGLKDWEGNLEYGEYTAKICTAPVVVIPPAPVPQVLPCGCTYKQETVAGNNTTMQAVPESCFYLYAPYQEGYDFLGFKKFVDDLLIPDEIIPNSSVTIIPDYSKCIRTQNILPAINTAYEFILGPLGWVNDTSLWQWGQPVDLWDACPSAVAYKAWGLNLSGNYTETLQTNLTIQINGKCPFNGTVNVSFNYTSYLAPGDVVYVEGWDGTAWTQIGSITNANNGCMKSFSGSFNMDTSGGQSWSSTKIRFRFVPNNDGNTDLGFYVFNVTVNATGTGNTCPVCVEYKPLAYVTGCQCLADYEGNNYYDISYLNSKHPVWAEAVYRVNATGAYTYNLSKPLVIIFDNKEPTIAKSENADSYIFTVTDNLAGVEANADSEPIKVKYKDVGFDFKRWPIYMISTDIQEYTYDLYDPLKQTRSVAVHFDRIEIGSSDYLGVVGGCEDCYIFEFGYEDCDVYYYGSWNDWEWHVPQCIHSAWVRVPLNDCEMNCAEMGYCYGCDYIEGCDDCAKIEYYDYRYDSSFGISIDMLVYGTGIAVLKNGVDITAQCTINSDGFNATVIVPKSLVTAGDEIVVVATDKVGNANYYKLTADSGVPSTPPPTTPPQEPWQNYDTNGNGDIEDLELITAIIDWLNGRIGDLDLISIILKWLI